MERPWGGDAGAEQPGHAAPMCRDRSVESVEADHRADASKAQMSDLARLDAMRDAARSLMARDQVGRDVFLRGAPEGLKVKTVPRVSRFDLFEAGGRFTSMVVPPELRGFEEW